MCEIFSIIGGAILGAVGVTGASAGIATAVGVGTMAVAGAGIGAGAAAIGGGNIWKGALFGAAGGVLGAGVGGAALGAGAGAIGGTGAAVGTATSVGGIGGGIAGGIGGGLMSTAQDKAKTQQRMANQAQKAALARLEKATPNQVGVQTVQKTATALKDRSATKRTISSLRIGLNTGDTSSGINIPT